MHMHDLGDRLQTQSVNLFSDLYRVDGNGTQSWILDTALYQMSLVGWITNAVLDFNWEKWVEVKFKIAFMLISEYVVGRVQRLHF